MRGSIEVAYEGSLHPEVLTYLAKDLGLLIEETRPLLVRSTDLCRDLDLVLDAARLIRGVRRVLVRQESEDHALTARNE